MTTPRRYWDSSCFLAWLLPEPARAPACRGVLNAAERGELVIVASALTLTEVIKLKGQPPLKADQEKKIRAFFENDYIVLRNVDRFIAESARDLIWKHPHLNPKDSIHLATALKVQVPHLDTYDDDFLTLNGKVGSGLTIGTPRVSDQEELPLMMPKKG
jgi:predicted nucleic acid-binding protein